MFWDSLLVPSSGANRFALKFVGNNLQELVLQDTWFWQQCGCTFWQQGILKNTWQFVLLLLFSGN